MPSEYLEALKIAADLGGATVIALALIYCVYRIFSRFGTAFVEAHQQIAQSMSAQAQSMSAQAQSMSEMRDGLDRLVNRDNSEHREILLGVQVMGDELKSLVNEIRELREERQ